MERELFHKQQEMDLQESLSVARIDFKNRGASQNDVKISVANEVPCRISSPAWFSKDGLGTGYVLETKAKHVKVQCSCIGSGRLELRLRGIDKRDTDNKRIPIWIDYTRLLVRKEEIFSKVVPVWHDKPFVFSVEATDGETVEVEVWWQPHTYTEEELFRIMPASEIALTPKKTEAVSFQKETVSENFRDFQHIPELLWAQVYHDTITNSEWLLDKSVSPGGVRGWAVGYNFLYALYRVLDEMRPKHILELGLGQSTKITGQYAGYFDAVHTVVEHDQEWVDFFFHGWKKLSQQTQICISPLVEREFDGLKYFAYQEFDKIMKKQNTTYELVLVDGPFGGRSERSRRDIIAYLPELLSKEFVIMVDDCGRKGEINLLREIEDILGRNKIEYASGLYKSGGNCHVGVLVCKKWKFFTTM